ncbi:MAG: hypothetical protein K2N72_07905 [Oscillospiraceae bacterium]|nr:hypothetical protein [Oscillospiraceae bacterium]
MKKIIIGVVCAVLLAAVFIHKHIDDNNAGTVTFTSWYVDENGVYHEYVEQILGEEETKRILSKEKEVSELLVKSDRIDNAEVSILKRGSSAQNDFSEALVSVVVSKNCALEKEDIDSFMGIVINALDSVKEENIIICDEAGNVLIA